MIAKIQENILVVVMTLVLFNVCMMVLHAALGSIKNYTSTKLDNKAWAILGKFIAGIQKSIDYSVANKEHK